MLIIVWLLFALVVGAFASSRGRSGLAFFLLSVLLSPIVGFIIALIVGSNTPPTAVASLPNVNPDFRAKWTNLARYDADISNAVDKLTPYGNEAVLRFRDIYETVNDKAAIPAIVADIEAHAKSITDPTGWAPEGFKQAGVENGVPVFRSGNRFWVGGEHFPDANSATAFAYQLGQAHRR